MKNIALADSYGSVDSISSHDKGVRLTRDFHKRFVTVNSPVPRYIDVPLGAELGYTVVVAQLGQGNVIFRPAEGVSIDTADGILETTYQFQIVKLFCYDGNRYLLSKSLSEQPVAQTPSIKNYLSALTYPDADPITVYFGPLGAGETDIYTVPEGKKLIVNGALLWNGTGTGNITVNAYLKSGPDYYMLSQFKNLAAGGGSAQFGPTAVNALASGSAEVGESITLIISATADSLYGYLSGFLVDDDYPYETIRVTTFALVPTLVYRVPDGKKALIMPLEGRTYPTVGNPIGFVRNDSGAAVDIKAYVVPSGETVALKHQTTLRTVNNGAQATQVFYFPTILSAGDSIYMSSTSVAAGQMAYFAVIEQDA